MGEAVLTNENTIAVEGGQARTERVRKFLLRDLPEPLTRAAEHVQIWDNYITGTRLRLRKVRTPQTKKWTLRLTQKSVPAPPDLSRTTVTDIHLSAQEYNVLAIFEGNEVRKNRYPFEHEGRRFQIDVFIGALWGLVIALTEFETDEELEAFTLPTFAHADITQDELFTGARLSQLTFGELRAEYQARNSASLNGEPAD